jgi:hypothetical protein
MWEPRRLTTLWACTAYYWDNCNLPFIPQTLIFRRIQFTTLYVARRQMVGLIYDELMEGLWTSSNYYPGIRPGRLRRTTKNLSNWSVPTEIPTGNFPNICHMLYNLRLLASKYSLISFLPYFGGLVLRSNHKISTVIYNTISQHCILHCNQLHLQSRRDWTTVKYGHQSALADTWTTRRDYGARTG